MSTWMFLPLVLVVGCLLVLARAFRHRQPSSSRDDRSYAMTGGDAYLYSSSDSSGSSDGSSGECGADGSGDGGGGDCGDSGGGGGGGD